MTEQEHDDVDWNGLLTTARGHYAFVVGWLAGCIQVDGKATLTDLRHAVEASTDLPKGNDHE